MRLVVISLQYLERLAEIYNELKEIQHCKLIITEESYDMSHLDTVCSQLDVRYKLWKYYEVAQQAIKEWLKMLFRKVQVISMQFTTRVYIFSGKLQRKCHQPQGPEWAMGRLGCIGKKTKSTIYRSM